MAQLPPIVIDFETYYTTEYSLTKMTPIEYVMDERFEIIGFAYGCPDGPTEWFSGTFDECADKLESLRLRERTVVAHNAQFDGSILEWRFGIMPAKYFCTMMGSRPYIHPFTGSMSLAKCAEYLELPQKGDEVAKVKDKHRDDFTIQELRRYGNYCERDVAIAAEVYKWLMCRMPDDEVDILDLTMKKYLRGRFHLDRGLLEEAQEQIGQDEAKALIVLRSLGLSRMDVTSNVRFAMALQNYGVTVPEKPSASNPAKMTFAFSKKDPEFLDLRKHPDLRVQQLVEARLLLKSSIERTRVAMFLQIEKLKGTALPIPLMYYGAHTGRFSGSMGINMQNLPRGSALRKAVTAPPGYKVVSVDLSAIEARITATLAGQWDLVSSFAHGNDVYSEFATDVYGYPVSKADPNTKTERFVGKTAILGLGFGMGVPKYIATMQAAGINVSDEDGERVVGYYRKRYPKIPMLWRRMDACVSRMLELRGLAFAGFPAEEPIIKFYNRQLVLPNGMPIHYPKLQRDAMNRVQYECFESPTKRYFKPLWGGALTENIVQALARIIISRAELRLARAGLVSVLQVHDELVYVVPEEKAQQVASLLQRVVTDPVPWMPGLPLACEVGIGDSYGDAK